MLNFINHPCFEKESSQFSSRFPKFNDGLDSFKKICEVHFYPANPKQVLSPGKLHRVKALDSYVLWKIELAVKNLRSNQSPRMWFAVQGTTIALLCIGTHIDNYDDGERSKTAESLATDIF